MSKVTTNKGIDGVEESMLNMTRQVAKKLGITLSDTQLCGDVLSELISATVQKYHQKVVVLIDEYDKPYTDFVNDPDMANQIRNILRSYYMQIKANDEYIRFTFITGISKFAKFGVFSTLNTPIDISLAPEFAEMCGYTEDEIVRYFPDYLEEASQTFHISSQELMERMRNYYNGFSFDSGAKARLYNPFSTLLFFRNREFFNYWIDSGQPKFIADYMRGRNLTVEQFRNFPISRDFAKSPGDVDTAPPHGFLYQSGYLTLRPGFTDDLSLDYPNTEVLNSMSELVTQNILYDKDESYDLCRTDLLTGLIHNDQDKVVGAFNRLLASIPYDDFTSAAKQALSNHNDNMQPQEWLYRSSILSFLRGCGVVVAAELHTHKGRPDLVVAYRGHVWVMEIKVAYKGESVEDKAEEAYRQIIEKDYAKPYPHALCLGLGLDDQQRLITHTKTAPTVPPAAVRGYTK